MPRPRVLAVTLIVHAFVCACASEEVELAAHDDGGGADASGALAHDAASMARPTDRGAVIPIAGAGVDAGICAFKERSCGAGAQTLGVDVGSPIGALHVQSIGAYYWNGFTVGTGLRLEGSVAGQPFVFSVERANELVEGGLRAATPPGRYGSGGSWSDVYARLLTCDRVFEPQHVELVIERHEVPQVIESGAPIQLAGRLVVSDPSWSVDVAFQIERVCEVDARI